MRKRLLLSALMTISAFGATLAQPSLNGCRHITDLSQIKEGAYYYIVSDRRMFKTDDVLTVAMSTTQSNYSAGWDNSNRKFVYWGELKMSNDGYLWKAEATGSQWAFQNAENGLYLGVMHKQHPYSTSSSETDMTFVDNPVGFTLTDMGENFAFTNSAITEPLNVHNYRSFTSRTVCSTTSYNDASASDAETNGYPGRWHLYELTGATALEDGEAYYIISDAKPYRFYNNNGKQKALSTLQNSSIHPREWGEKYVYWGDFVPSFDGYVWTAEKHGYKWAFKNTKNNKYIGNENEPQFSTSPVCFILSDLLPDANRFFVQPEGDTRSIHVQSYTQQINSCALLTSWDVSDAGNDEDGYGNRWHFIKVSDYVQSVAAENAGTNTVTKIYAAESGDNIIKGDGTCSNFVLTDGADLNISESFTAISATYNRSMSKNWGTVCLPYEVSSNSDVTYYTAGSINGDVLTLTSAETVPAGTPAILKVNGGTFTATGNNVEVLTGAQNESITDDDIVLRGTLVKLVFDDVTTDTENDYYYISNNMFMHATKKLTVNPFRAYFTMAKGNAPSNGFSIAVDDDSMTAIGALTGEGDTTITAIYTTDGKQLSDLQQGLNIVKLSNGKVQKIMVK